MYNVLLMEAKWNVRNPWYLMPKDKLRKVKCKFCDNIISHRKDRMLKSIWAIDMMAMGELELQCVQKHIHRWRHYLFDVVDFSLHH
jgi:hypothetical protein